MLIFVTKIALKTALNRFIKEKKKKSVTLVTCKFLPVVVLVVCSCGLETSTRTVNLFRPENQLNTNTIPLAFSPSTEAHDAVIKYYFPTAAGRIFDFLTRRAKPGTSQQFDKDDFDQHCIRVGRNKPYSKYWFKTCFDLLVSIRLIQVERVFRGYGYQVRVYHPWQVDDWVVDEFKNPKTSDRAYNNHSKKAKQNSHDSDRSDERSQENFKKTCNNFRKTCTKSTRNSDSAVALDRENRLKEKGNTKANSIGDRIKLAGDRQKPTSDRRRVPKPILKKTAFAAAPPKTIQEPLNSRQEEMRADGKEDTSFTQTTDRKETATTGKKRTTPTDEINQTQKTAVSNTVKGGEHINCRPTPSTSLKNDLNVKSDNVNQVNGANKNNGKVDVKVNKEKSRTESPKVDVKINNKEWRSHLEEVDQLGIRGNKTIVNALKTFSTERVKAAIALYRQRKRENGYIENPCGYFMQALQEDWAGKKAKEVLDNSQAPEDEAALFRYWFDLAKEFGYCHLYEIKDGERWVCLTGTWQRFVDAWERGFTLEYLRKMKKRNSKS